MENLSILDRPVVARRITLAHIILIILIILSAVLHFWDISAIGNSNEYYTAAVESMTQSWDNFFFVAAEPGGSVSVDKPPLGLWIESLFALVLGVSGFSTSLPNILAGILSVPLMHHLVRKHLGTAPALLAALVIAVTPIVYATDRNNTADGMLTFVLLLAAWAFLKASASGKLRHILLGAFLVGLGFNIKMLEAFLPLPAFYALYFFVSRRRWGIKLLQLGIATLLLIAVSLSWAVAVDLTPAEERPYVGSSDNNTVLDLIIGYNGLQRLLGHSAAQQPYGQPPIDQPVPGKQGGAFGNEVGQPGMLRFFQLPLAKEMSWLLPFALAGTLLAVFSARIRFPVESPLHQALLLWGGWLLTCLVFFSAAEFFHAYYMILLVPALAGTVALAFAALRTIGETRPVLAIILFNIIAILTITVQAAFALTMATFRWWMMLPLLALFTAAIFLFISRVSRENDRPIFATLGNLAFILAVTIIPLAWSVLTVSQTGRNNLPNAWSGDRNPVANAALPNQPYPARLPLRNPYAAGDLPAQLPAGNNASDQPAHLAAGNDALLTYLQDNTAGMEYLVAVPSAQVGASMVIASGRPVLYMGGFNGSDPVIDGAGLQQLVAAGDLRYIILQEGRNPGKGITAWVMRTCTPIPRFSNGGLPLFDCAAP